MEGHAGLVARVCYAGARPLCGGNSGGCATGNLSVLHPPEVGRDSHFDIAGLAIEELHPGRDLEIFLSLEGSTMIPTLIRRAAAGAKAAGPKVPETTVFNNPYKTKKVWPPDFSHLSPQEQFRYEKRFKRRLQVMATRPKDIRRVQLAQLFTMTCELSVACS